jgi:hypothetical protein
LAHSFFNGVPTKLGLPNISGYGQAVSPFCFHSLFSFLGISFLNRQMNDGHVCSFSSEENCDGTTNSRISSCYQSNLIL